MYIAFARLGVGDQVPRAWMPRKEVLQAISQRPVLGPAHQPLVEHDADAHVTAFQGNAPRPPSRPNKVIGGGRANTMASHRPIRIFFRQVNSIPILYPGPPG